MKKVVKLTENDLVNIIKKVISESKKSTSKSSESKKSTSKSEVLKMSEDELKDVKVNGEYLNKKGEFHNFKKVMGKVICSFRADKKTPSGLRRATKSIPVNDTDVTFD